MKVPLNLVEQRCFSVSQKAKHSTLTLFDLNYTSVVMPKWLPGRSAHMAAFFLVMLRAGSSCCAESF